MKTFKLVYNTVLTFIFGALIFDGLMIYCHFFNTELGSTIIKNIDKVIY